MQLRSALRVGPRAVVAFVGGGGKTTAMFRLAAEIAAAGGRVVTTTTTRIFAAQIGLAPAHFRAEGALLPDVAAALERLGHVLVTGPVDHDEGKSFGIDPGLVAVLRALPGEPIVLVEADGSRMRPLKAPAAHEPVIPPDTTLVVPVAGADVFGAPLDAERVHRADLAATLAGMPLGAPVTPAAVARILAHAQGGLKGVPPGAAVIPLINKVESDAALAAGREAAAVLLETPAITAVALGQVRRDDPVREVWAPAAGVVLAAGRSLRMGRTKQLLPWRAGGTVLGEVVARLQAAGLAPVVVVTGHDRERVEASVAGRPGVVCVFNPDFAAAEMARSLQVGLQALPARTGAVVVALADQPQVEPDVVRRVVQRWRETQAPAVAPFYRDQRGHPLLFDRALWDRLRALPAEANPRAALAQTAPERVAVDTDTILRDMDTPEDYAREAGR